MPIHFFYFSCKQSKLSNPLQNEPQADAVENEPEDELVEKPDLDMFQDGSKFQRCLSSLLTTLTNSCNFVEDLERIRKEANETNQQHIQSIKDDYELKIEKMNKSSCDEKLDQLNQMFALKEKIIEQLEFELNELKTEEEKLRKLVNVGTTSIIMLIFVSNVLNQRVFFS